MTARDPNYQPEPQPGDTAKEIAMLTCCAFDARNFVATCDGDRNGTKCNLRLCEGHAKAVGDRHYCPEHA